MLYPASKVSKAVSTRGFSMSSASQCSRKVTIRGVKVDLDRYAVWSRSADGSLARVRHRTDLEKDADYVVVLKSRELDVQDIAQALDDTTLHPEILRMPYEDRRNVKTHQGGPGHLRDPRSALILASLGTWKGSDTFHESDVDRSTRLRSLVQQATLSDPDWVRDLIPFIRSEGNMRTVSIHAALDAAAIGHPDAAQIIKDTLQRADEPGVALKYWFDTYGKSMPASVKKGLAAAALNLYSQRNVLRYGNSGKNRVSAADVLRLTHPKPSDTRQEKLFQFLTTRDKDLKNSLRDELEVFRSRKNLTALDSAQRLRLMQQERESAVQALLSGDKSHKSALSVFSTTELAAWISQAAPKSPEQQAAQERHRSIKDEVKELHAQSAQTSRELKRARQKAFSSLRDSEMGSDFSKVKEELVKTSVALRESKDARRQAVRNAGSTPHWERDATVAAVINACKEAESRAFEAYQSAKTDYTRQKFKIARAAEEMIPSGTKTAADKVESMLYDASFRLKSATEDLRDAQPGISAAVWETRLPNMGYMELLRNVRNMEESGVASDILETAASRLSDPEQIRASRQMPLRFWSAAKALSDSRTFEAALESGLEISTEAVPPLGGRTLILVDQSGSMGVPYGGRRNIGNMNEDSQATLGEVAALYGAALAKRSKDVDLVMFGTSHHLTTDVRDSSILDSVRNHGSASLGGTNTWAALNESFQNHDRVIILSDGQSSDRGSLPKGVPVHFFDLTGHSVSFANDNSPNYYAYGGLSDLSFRLFAIMEGATNSHAELLTQERSKDDES
jgi:hypothetical protein